ncbi:MAG: hypothetical protein OXC44_04640 [Proteobacteria bacterium]|nr:hypothetical protein [Pseudomonadota bacterium]
MSQSSEILSKISAQQMHSYEKQGMILSFAEYLDLVCKHPQRYLRHSSAYLVDMFAYYGTSSSSNPKLAPQRYRLFDLGQERYESVIGGEAGQDSIVGALKSSVRLGGSPKLIVLHGPNGSSKSSTMECITKAMQEYSRTDEGAVYRFSWIFPRDKELPAVISGESREIGFAGSKDPSNNDYPSYSGLSESKIASKIDSEFKENPIYLLPEAQRISLVESLLSDMDDVTLRWGHVFKEGLSKRNQEIFDRLLSAYGGDIKRVFQHVQVERFYFSAHYRVGIATVEPQMSLDARERQLTMDRYLKELPAVLQTLSFYECSGELVDGHRGVVEFSDFLKRPIEAFKYLLSTIEKSTIHLPSATAFIDTVFFATTNDKHWDAFQEIPDFNSFLGRMHILTVPYLLKVSDEMKIYRKDCQLLSAEIKIAPHTLYMLCLWGVMSRLKAPQTEGFSSDQQKVLKSLNALVKAKLYNDDTLRAPLSREDRRFLQQNRDKIMAQYRGGSDYEGKRGASPRHIRDILHRSAALCSSRSKDPNILGPLDIFEHIQNLIKVKKLYEFLRLPVTNMLYHPDKFVDWLKEEYAYIFEQELLDSMSMVEGDQYKKLLSKYLDQVVAIVRGEKVFDPSSASYVEPNMSLLKEVEQILGVTKNTTPFRKSLLSRIAAWKIDHPHTSYEVSLVFEDLLKRIKHHILSDKKKQVMEICINMIKLSEKTTQGLSQSVIDAAQLTFDNLKNKYSYDQVSVVRSLRFLLHYKKHV